MTQCPVCGAWICRNCGAEMVQRNADIGLCFRCQREKKKSVVPELTDEEKAKKLADERKPLGPPPMRKGGKSEVRQ